MGSQGPIGTLGLTSRKFAVKKSTNDFEYDGHLGDLATVDCVSTNLVNLTGTSSCAQSYNAASVTTGVVNQ